MGEGVDPTQMCHLDAAWHLCRRHGLKPYPLRLSFDPHHVSYFGGQVTKGGEGRSRLVVHGLCFMLGLALTNSALGVAASLTGGLMGAVLQNPIVLVVVAAVLVLFATSLFGLWDIRLPSGLTQAAAKSYTGYFGSLFSDYALFPISSLNSKKLSSEY